MIRRAILIAMSSMLMFVLCSLSAHAFSPIEEIPTNISRSLSFSTTTNTNDSLALVALYNQCDGPNWVKKTNWLTGSVGTWEGVVVENGRVVELHFGDYGNEPAGLVGEIPSEIANLSELRIIRMGRNTLTGPLPENWSGLTKLVEISLMVNELTGSLPESWSNLLNLENIDLSENQLSDQLPSNWSALENLKFMFFSKNEFSGSLPESWTSMTSLVQLSLSYNQLSGILPDSWSDLLNLADLRLDQNQFSGSLPKSWSNLKNLTALDLSVNQFSGELPVEWANMESLAWFFIAWNDLSGSLPESWTDLSDLERFVLAGNNFTGTITEEWFMMSSLYELNIPFNEFSGTLPDIGIDNVSIEFLNLSNNQLEGIIPQSWSKMTKLKEVDLSMNNLEGDLPKSWASFQHLWNLGLANNKFSGSLPQEWSSMENLSHLRLTSNLLSGNFPETWSNLTKLVDCRIDNNQITGSIPSEWGSFQSLNIFYLSQNKITTIPDFSLAKSLAGLNVQDNNLDFGDIEPNVDLLPEVQFIYSPQKKVGTVDTLSLSLGDEFRISISIGGTSNQYQWYKNDEVISDANQKEYLVNSISTEDAGNYTCRIINSVATDLILYSHPITLEISIGSLPTVSTDDPLYVTESTAECGGRVLSEGASNVTARGVCWSTTQNPTTDDPKTINGKGSGGFVSSITGLTGHTTYYIRAYATSSEGTAYGEEKSITTNDVTQPDFVIVDAEAYPNAITAIGRFSVRCGYLNQGFKSETASFLKTYLSKDSIWDQSDHLLYDVLMLQPDHLQYYEVYNLTLPDDITNGKWYVLLVADAEDNVIESNEDNNISMVEIWVGSLGIQDTPLKSEFIVYPNPTSEKITIQIPETTSIIQIFSISGQLVEEIDNSGMKTKIIANIQEEGLYIIRLYLRGEVLSKRVLVVK